MNTSRRLHPYVFLLAAAHHLTVVAMLLQSPAVLGVSSVAMLSRIFGGQRGVIVALLAASAASVYGIFSSKPIARFAALPQQFILFVTAVGAGEIILGGMYADGVPRPREFIGADQSIYVWMFVWHTLALLEWFGVFDLVLNFTHTHRRLLHEWIQALRLRFSAR